jgi:hypothetical protein
VSTAVDRSYSYISHFVFRRSPIITAQYGVTWRLWVFTRHRLYYCMGGASIIIFCILNDIYVSRPGLVPDAFSLHIRVKVTAIERFRLREVHMFVATSVPPHENQLCKSNSPLRSKESKLSAYLPFSYNGK